MSQQTPHQRRISQLVAQAELEEDEDTLALGFLRYEAIRKLSPRQFAELHARNLKGVHFDSLIDELVTTP